MRSTIFALVFLLGVGSSALATPEDDRHFMIACEAEMKSAATRCPCMMKKVKSNTNLLEYRYLIEILAKRGRSAQILADLIGRDKVMDVYGRLSAAIIKCG